MAAVTGRLLSAQRVLEERLQKTFPAVVSSHWNPASAIEKLPELFAGVVSWWLLRLGELPQTADRNLFLRIQEGSCGWGVTSWTEMDRNSSALEQRGGGSREGVG
jgi:hypothetical protein